MPVRLQQRDVAKAFKCIKKRGKQEAGAALLLWFSFSSLTYRLPSPPEER